MIYVASPYSSPDKELENTRYRQVVDFCYHALTQGMYVYSPIVHWHPVSRVHNLPGDAVYWDRINMQMLRRAEQLCVLLLPGWDQSRGVARELSIAETLHIPVIRCEYKSTPNAHNSNS